MTTAEKKAYTKPGVKPKVTKYPAEEYPEDTNQVLIPEATCRAESANAILVWIDGDENWIPKSQVHGDSEVYQLKDIGKLIISKWIARQRGLYAWDE